MKFFFSIILIFVFTNLYGNSKNTASDLNSVSQVLFIKEDNLTGESLFYQDIVKLGYSVDVIPPDEASNEKLELYELVILSTGNYPFACQNSDMRLAVQSYITNFGKVIIEGGNNGYIAAVFPGYLGFMNKVIKIDNWIADNGGALNIAGTHAFSNLAMVPNILPAAIEINYTSVNNQDVCTNNEFSELFYGTALYPDKVGILVAPNVENPQVINYFVTYSSFSDNSVSIKLLENSIYNLIGKPVSVNYISDVEPDSYSLYQNYPNPFNPTTKIKFDVVSSDRSNSSFIKLTVYNTAGELVSEILNGKFSSGTYEADFDAGNIPGGIYFYKLTVEGGNNNYTQTKKMIVLK